MEVSGCETALQLSMLEGAQIEGGPVLRVHVAYLILLKVRHNIVIGTRRNRTFVNPTI